MQDKPQHNEPQQPASPLEDATSNLPYQQTENQHTQASEDAQHNVTNGVRALHAIDGNTSNLPTQMELPLQQGGKENTPMVPRGGKKHISRPKRKCPRKLQRPEKTTHQVNDSQTGTSNLAAKSTTERASQRKSKQTQAIGRHKPTSRPKVRCHFGPRTG